MVRHGRRIALRLAEASDPWTRQAAEGALTGADPLVRKHVRTGLERAAAQDDRVTLRSVATVGSRRLKDAADAALAGYDADVRNFLRNPDYPDATSSTGSRSTGCCRRARWSPRGSRPSLPPNRDSRWRTSTTRPGAQRILDEDKVQLLSGDGHVVYTPCGQQPSEGIGLMEVRTTDLEVGPNDDGVFCLKVIGTSGYLTMLVPDVFEIRGDGHGRTPSHGGIVEVREPSGEQRTDKINPNGALQVGTGRSTSAKPETLLRVEIKP
ncbi:ALF repeat-containing protein [Saccharothrix australiensis]|uniref:Uncharacterized protein n=1 Tax=Saccharothrix australiensis TaxID=2072 RepID=A0A495VZE4_9PSEU|nr:ALF repeat-containing protein [Saccharothrix australiensis]RKT54579.1 hypothetical protein C8E97_3223 [Saccharothrix australiensis]